MRPASWKNLFCTLLLLPAAAVADDAVSDDEHESEAYASSDTVWSLVDYDSRWRLSNTIDTNTYFDRWQGASMSLDVPVQDGSSIMRVAQIRTLSLFTISGDERSKWFVGINEDGLVGVHFRGFTRESAKRHVDLATLLDADEDEDSAY